MRLSPHPFFVPLLLCFSVTGGAVILLYFLNKKDEDEQKFKSRKPKQTVLELKVPRQKVPMIIGRGGQVLEQIKQKTSTVISFKEESDVDLPDRICIIIGSQKNIKSAEEEIQSILSNQPLIETYEKLVPQRTINTLLERGGEVLNQIQNSSSAKIDIVDHSLVAADSDIAGKRVILKGTAVQIADALNEIESRIVKDRQAQIEVEADNSTKVPRRTSPVTSKNDTLKNTSYSKDSFEYQDSEGPMEVYVSAIINPSKFFIQNIRHSTELKQLVDDMTNYYEDVKNRELHALKKIELGQMVAAKLYIDDKWYRAEVMKSIDNENYDVRYADYGDDFGVNKTDILELRTDFLSSRFQAIECSLAGVKPRDGEWTEEAVYKFQELCAVAQWVVREAKVRRYKDRVQDEGHGRREGSTIYCVELYQRLENNQLKNIGKELIELGLAVPDDEPWSATSSTLSLRVTTSPEATLDTSNESSSNGSSNNGFVKLEHGDAAAAALPVRKSPGKKYKRAEKSTSQFSDGSFLENERKRSSDEKKTTEKPKPLPQNPFQKKTSSTSNYNPERNIMPAGYEDDLDSDEYDDYDEFDF